MFVNYHHLSRQELDDQLSPSRSAKDPMGVLSRLEATTAQALASDQYHVQRDLPTGIRPAQRMDLITPSGPGPFPCLIFIHGGFWQEGSKAGSGFAAERFAAQGWATAMVGYSLTPHATLTEIVEEIAQALQFMQHQAHKLNIDPNRTVMAGHSAGAYLVAAIICGKAGRVAADSVAGAVLISGVYDLAPIASSYVNRSAQISNEEVALLSITEPETVRDIPIHIVIGVDESDQFQQQSDNLYRHWTSRPNNVTHRKVAGRDHFDVLEELAEPDAGTFNLILGM